jgi:hypothetical protein
MGRSVKLHVHMTHLYLPGNTLMVAKLFARWVMNHRITSIVLMVLSALVLGLGGINAEFSANQSDFFRADDVHLNNLVHIED